MTSNTKSFLTAKPAQRSLILLILALGLILTILFYRSFQHGQALFSNDGPLAVQVAAPFQIPGAFFGIWNDLFWLGSYIGHFSPDIISSMLLLLGPHGYTNFHLPIGWKPIFS